MCVFRLKSDSTSVDFGQRFGGFRTPFRGFRTTPDGWRGAALEAARDSGLHSTFPNRERYAKGAPVHAQDPRSSPTQTWVPARLSGDCSQLRARPKHGQRLSGPSRLARLSWLFPATLRDQDLEARLFHRTEIEPKGRLRPQPDYSTIDAELRQHRRLNLTLDLLWREYKAQHLDGYQYTQFVAHYHRWRRQQDVCFRHTHRYGEKLFVDFADGLALVDPQTGARTPTALFVGVWGASNYTYAEACPAQNLPSWEGVRVLGRGPAHRRARQSPGRRHEGL